MIYVSHPTGNTFVRALLASLQEDEAAFHFFTTLGLSAESRLPGLAPARLARELERRRYELPRSRLTRWPAREIGRLLATQLGLPTLWRGEKALCSVDAVYRGLDRRVARFLRRPAPHPAGAAVYAYEDGALETFAAAREVGVRRCYELPIAYWETGGCLMRQEAERWPEWEPTLGATRDSPEKLACKTAELEAAELVICPSQFVLRSLPAAVRESKPCVVAEFGTPASAVAPRPVRSKNSPLRLLFVGSMTQRKGLADLFAALKLLGPRQDLELVVLGTAILPLEFYRQQYGAFRYEAPRPHAEVLALMRQCDLFVFPSILEGRALVQQEAMSAGLPLLVTANAGGEDLVEPGRTGFLVPVGDPAALAERIAWCAEHRAEVEEMGRQAQAKAAGYSWPAYAEKIRKAVQDLHQRGGVPLSPHQSIAPVPPSGDGAPSCP